MVFHWVKGKKILPNDRKKLFNVDLEFVQFFEIFIENLEKEKKIRELGNFRWESDGRVLTFLRMYILYIDRMTFCFLITLCFFLSFFKWHCGRELFQLLLEFSASN